MYLYKRRWDIEVAFKHIKTNFKIRHICKESNMLDGLQKNKFWLNMSFMMYNMTRLIKNELDFKTKNNCRFTKCASFIRKIMTNYTISHNRKKYLKQLVDKIIIIGKRFLNNRERNLNFDRKKEIGKNKSFTTITMSNICSLLGICNNIN